MVEAKITVDLYCNWTAEPKAYRVYFDDDLLTERTYLWRNTEQYVQENIIVYAEPGQHSLKITPVDRSFGGFLMGKVTVNGQPASANQIVL
jgi:hypothetical protein